MKRKGIARMLIGLLIIILGIVWLLTQKSEEIIVQNPSATSLDGEYCYVRIQVATSDAPYNVEEHIKISIQNTEVSGVKVGMQSGPDMTNGYQGTLEGNKKDDNLELVYSYTIEGADNKELEIYSFSADQLQKERYVLKEENDMLVPDKTNPPTLINYDREMCYN